MSEVPDAWIRVSVDDCVAARRSGYWGSGTPTAERPLAARVIRNGDIKFGRISSWADRYFSEAEFERSALDNEDVLITTSGHVGKSAMATPGYCASNFVRVLRPLKEVVLGRYLRYALMTRVAASAMDAWTGGSTIQNLRSGFFGDPVVPLAPVNEQRRIVAAIEEHFSRLDAADASLAAAAARASFLREHAATLGMRGDWPTVGLGEIAEVVGGVTKDTKRQGDPDYVEVPYLRVANVQRGFLDLAEVTTIRVPPAKAAALALRAGDVLFNEGGDRDKLGRGWVWSGEIAGCIHQNHVFRARLNGDYDPKFVSWHGNTFGREWFETRGKQTTNLASLNLTTLKAFPIPVLPLKEQRRIVAQVEEQLSAIDALRAAIERAQRRSKSLRRAVLERAFRGELVPQDPSDEPAEALLARIRAERNVAAPARRSDRDG